MPTPRRRKALFMTIALAFSLLLALGSVELATRLLNLAPPLDTQSRAFVADPVLPYRPRPHSETPGRAVTGEYAFPCQHNSEGFRDVEHAKAKPPGTYRILGLGDSFTYGMGAGFGDTYLARLEAKLAASSIADFGLRIADAGNCGFRISDCGFEESDPEAIAPSAKASPQSAIRNPKSEIEPTAKRAPLGLEAVSITPESEIRNPKSEVPAARPPQSVEVIKAGIPGYYPESQRLLAEHYGFAYQPDLVLVGFVPNDVTDTARGLSARVVDGDGCLKTRAVAELGTTINRLGLYSHFCRLCLKKYSDHCWQTAKEIHYEAIYQPNGPHEEDWRKLESEYVKLKAACDQHGCKLVILHIPQKGPWEARHRYPAERLAALCQQHNIGLIDALPAMQAHACPESLYYPKDGHCTPAGYAVLAEVVARGLKLP